LLSIQDYYALSGAQQDSLLNVMDASPGGVDIEFDPPKAHIALLVVDLG
jgi:hypothetical protein